MNCPFCSHPNVKKGTNRHDDGIVVQNYRCKGCGKRFNERTGTPMARLRTSVAIVSYAMKVRTEGSGVRAKGRAFDKSHSTILRWEQRLADQEAAWSPPAPENTDITLEGDEVYNRVGGNFPPSRVSGLDH